MNQEMQGAEWLSWKLDARTQRFLELLRQSVLTAQEQWLEGAYRSSDGTVDLMLNNVALADARAKQQIITDIEDIKIEDEDAKSDE